MTGHALSAGGGTGAGNPGGVPIGQLAAELPAAVAALGGAARWDIVEVSASGATIWRLDQPGEPTRLLHVAPEAGGAAADLRARAERLAWLAPRLEPAGMSVPAVVASVTDPDSGEHYLATTAVAGTQASRTHLMADADSLVTVLAEGLRRWHELPVPACGAAVTSVDDQLARAAARVRAGLVDARHFAPIHARYSPEQLYEHLMALRPEGWAVGDEPVVVHGAPTLDVTMIDGDRVVGYADPGHAGVGDRYLDLAVVARELVDRVSPHALGPFFAAYGIENPDLPRLEFYVLLSELV